MHSYFHFKTVSYLACKVSIPVQAQHKDQKTVFSDISSKFCRHFNTPQQNLSPLCQSLQILFVLLAFYSLTRCSDKQF